MAEWGGALLLTGYEQCIKKRLNRWGGCYE